MSGRVAHEPVAGLHPEEEILWQGRPDQRYLAFRVFRAGWMGSYLSFFMLLRGALKLAEGAPPLEAFMAMAWVAPLVGLGVAIPMLMAWAHARSTRYTLTAERWVLEFGVAIQLTVNLPMKQIRSAAFSADARGFGDIPMVLAGTFRGPNGEVLTTGPSYFHLWPNARPWHLTEPQPMLRGLPEVATVARIFAETLQNVRGLSVANQPSPEAGDTALTSPTLSATS